MLKALPVIDTIRMAKTTISHELARKYPEFNGRFGETVDTSEVQSVMRKHGDQRTVAESVAAKKAKTEPTAPAAAPAPAAAKRAPAKAPAKKVAKKAAKRAAKRTR